ncbi:MAG: hypothetical protein C0597_01405 [Marinilabiliales bacterium]|nr:MAG: hypothetical protein C0597_01405 [Marinilabiliales bacterium]
MIETTNSNLLKEFYLRLCNLICIILFITTCSFGQTVEEDSVSVSDSIDYSDIEFNFYMLDFHYTNNKIKSKGSNPDITIPAFISDFTFLHKTGVKTGVMLTNYTNADTLSYDLDFLLGYQKDFFNNKLDVDLSYMYHNFTGMNDFKGLNYNHIVNVSSGFTYKMIYFYADATFHLDDKNYFLDLGYTSNIDFESILVKDDYLFILPTVSVTFGTDYWLYDIYEPYIENFLIPYLHYRGYPTYNLTTEDLVERYLQNQGLSTNTFSYQGIDFLLPITYGIGSVSASFSWMYYIPSDKLKAFGLKDQSGYIVSLSFIF